MTCNSKWSTTNEHLIEEEEAQNRPDLIVMVFHAKLEEFKNELFKKIYRFGELAAYTCVIEFRKKKLPLCTLLVNSKTSVQNVQT